MSKTFGMMLGLLLAVLPSDFSGQSLAPFRRLNPSVQVKTSLRLEVRIRYGDEDAEIEPAEADFYLLDESLISILKKAKLKPVGQDRKRRRREKDEDYLEAAAKILIAQTDDEERALAFLIKEAIEPHRASVIRTNQSGRGYFKEIEAGNFYLFGIAQINREIIVWHLPVAVRPGSGAVEIDQHDAALIFPSGT